MERYRSGHNEAVLKTVCPQGRVGSNPTLSASNLIIGNWFGEVPKLAEGTPLERVQVVNSGARVQIPPSPLAVVKSQKTWKKLLTNRNGYDKLSKLSLKTTAKEHSSCGARGYDLWQINSNATLKIPRFSEKFKNKQVDRKIDKLPELTVNNAR